MKTFDWKPGLCHSVMIRYVSLLGLFAAFAFAQTASPLTLTGQVFYSYGLAISLSSSVNVVVGEYNRMNFQYAGGSGNVTVKVTGGHFPDGLDFSVFPTTASGVSTAAGIFNFTLTATDDSGQTATQSYTVTAAPQFSVMIGGTPASALVNVPYVPYVVGTDPPPIYARGGIPPYHWTVLEGVLPPGITLPQPDQMHADLPDDATFAFGCAIYQCPNVPGPFSAIQGTPSAPGTFSFMLQVSDSSTPPVTATQTYTLSVIALNPFTDPNNGLPTGIVVGPDGNLWFTQQGAVALDENKNPIYGLESISPAGSFNNETEFTKQVPSPTSDSAVYPVPQSIAVGPDGSFWMTDNSDYAIVAAKSGAPGARIALYNPSDPSFAPLSPTGIASGGSEGGVWFSAVQGNSPGTGFIGRIDSNNAGTSPTLYPITQNSSSYPTGIVQNPQDGNAIWFLDQSFAPAQGQNVVVIGRIPVPINPGNLGNPFQMPAGCQSSNALLGFAALSECVINGTQGHVQTSLNGNAPVGPLMQVDSTGTVWFATRDQIGSISADGSKVQLFLVRIPSATFQINSLALGSDGAVWFIGFDPRSNYLRFLGRLITSGANYTINQFSLPPGALNPDFSNPQSIATGPDGALWFTDAVTAYGRVVQAFPSLALNCSVPSTLPLNVPIPSNAQCSALGGKAPYTYTYDKTNAPQGVTISSSGVLSGTPTTPGSFNIQVSDSSAPPQQANQLISIPAPPAVPPTIQLSCNNFPPGVPGISYFGYCIAAKGMPPYTYTISPPTALSALGLTGVAASPPAYSSYGFIASGIVSASASGTVTFTVTATDSATPVPNTSGPQPVAIAITQSRITPLSLSCSQNAQAVVGKPFQQQCFGWGGAPPYTFSASGLPQPLSIGKSTGVIGGTATSRVQTPLTVQVQVIDSIGQTANATINFSVVNPKLSISCSFPPSPTVGTAYTAACTASGGVSPYKYSVFAGTLPGGLTLNPNTGTVSGTLTDLGFTFSLLVTDSESPPAGAFFFENLVNRPTQLTVLSTSLLVPNPNLPYAVLVKVDGGTQPYTFAIAGGALPGGLQLSAASGIISSTGTALATGPYSFTVQVKDSTGAIATQAYSGTITAAPPPAFNSFALPAPARPNGITLGVDGALWFTTLNQAGGNTIGSITTAGAIDTWPSANALTQGASPELPTGGDITPGPDGNLWIAQRDGQVIGEIDSTGAFQSTYMPPTGNSSPAQITAGLDGALWFTEAAASKIGRVAPGGAVRETTTPTPGAFPLGIAHGSFNFMVFTEPTVNKIGYISTDGTTTGDITIPTANALPTSIVLGPDNAFWFTEYGASKIGRMDFNFNFTEYPVSSPPTAITLGPDEALYFTESAANKIGRVTIAGAVTEFPVPDMNSGPAGIVAGPDGALWFTENTASRIGRLSFTAPLPLGIACNTPVANWGAAYVPSQGSYGCNATNGTPPYQYALTSGTLPPGLALDTQTGNITGRPTAFGSFPIAVQVTDSSHPVMTASAATTIEVQYGGASTSTGEPFTLMAPPILVDPGGSVPGLTLAAKETLPVAVTGTATLIFRGSSQLKNTPAGYVDPALQFVDSNGNGTGTTYNFNIPAGSSAITLPGFNVGTVAGDIDIMIAAGGVAQQTGGKVTVPSSAPPVVDSGSVQFTNVTDTGFDLEFVGTSATRALDYVTVTLNPAPGDQIVGQSTFDIMVSTAMKNWFQSSASSSYGGRFSITLPFESFGDVSAIGSATVTATVGAISSQPVTGNK